jgi:toxin ParE1/3/4
VEHIYKDSPRIAVEAGDRVRDAALVLQEFPMIGKEGRIAGTRELVVTRYRCVLVYRVTDNTVEIVRVIHGGQLWQEDLSG